MKKTVVLVITLLSALSLEAQTARYDITGKIEGAEGEAFTLQKMMAGKSVVIDSATSVNGVFRMNGGAVEYPEWVNLMVRNKKKNVTFFLENSKITITGSLDSLNKATITGSKTQDEYAASQAMIKEYVDNFRKVMDEFTKVVQKSQLEFIKSHPGSYAVPKLLQEWRNDIPPEEVSSVIQGMDPAVAATPAMKEIISGIEAKKAVAVGKKAPDFTLNDPDGVPVTLSSLKGHKLLLIDFWAAWCAPCRRENPNVVKVYNDYHTKGFDILGVSLDRKKEDWVKAIADDKLVWKQVSDLSYFNSPVAKQYNVTSIPANLLLDEKGVIIDKNLRGEALLNKIKAILDK